MSVRGVNVDNRPYLKRLPYEDEREYRIVYDDHRHSEQHKSYDISLSCIDRITLSPWLPQALSDSVKETLRSIAGCSRIRIYRSTMLENETRKQLTTRARDNDRRR
jgi:hypothetical protein